MIFLAGWLCGMLCRSDKVNTVSNDESGEIGPPIQTIRMLKVIEMNHLKQNVDQAAP